MTAVHSLVTAVYQGYCAENICIHLYAISGHCGVVSDCLNADHEQYIKTNP